jgi:N-methylhydantoinase A/oxoprolinase/acetone carboxylase beta subunit
LRARVDGGQHFTFAGGHHINGAPIEPLDEPAIRAACESLKARLVADAAPLEIVVVGTFSCSTPQHELECEKLIVDVLGDRASVTLSHRCGTAHLIKRENASILNASLRPLSRRICAGFRTSLDQVAAKCPLYLTANDGCLMTLNEATLYPVLTIASGPTNSMRGFVYCYFHT